MELSNIKDRITPLERETFSKNFTFNEDKLTSHATEILENLKKDIAAKQPEKLR